MIIVIIYTFIRDEIQALENDKITDRKSGDDQRAMPETWPSEQLLKGQSYALILHKGNEYRLQKTRSGKLILTK